MLFCLPPPIQLTITKCAEGVLSSVGRLERAAPDMRRNDPFGTQPHGERQISLMAFNIREPPARLRDLLQELHIGLCVLGRRVDAPVPQDQPDLLERNAVAQHLVAAACPRTCAPLTREGCRPPHQALHQ